tara:strand:+ start:108 stop:551 length:444 start_codon:yes stop_codon:yes gene_type:complete
MLNKKSFVSITFGLIIFSLGLLVGSGSNFTTTAQAQSNQVFELRTYTTYPDRLEALETRFRDHTVGLFERHGMTNIGYFVPQDAPLSDNTLIYILAHDSREAAKESFSNFVNDPDWKKVYKESHLSGPIVENIESVFMDPTDYSLIK